MSKLHCGCGGFGAVDVDEDEEEKSKDDQGPRTMRDHESFIETFN